MSELGRIIDGGGSRAQVTGFLTGLSAAAEKAAILALGRDHQATLWNIAGSDPLPTDIEFFVPESAAPYEPKPFDGRNSLPTFRSFQKVFYRTDNGQIGGFNNQLLMRVTGPGYYVAELHDARPGEVAVDYRETPTSKPSGWPKITSNRRVPARFIYGGTVDYLRRVSDRSAIGRAFRDGTDPMPNWFVLVRGHRLDGFLGRAFWGPRLEVNSSSFQTVPRATTVSDRKTTPK